MSAAAGNGFYESGESKNGTKLVTLLSFPFAAEKDQVRSCLKLFEVNNIKY